MALATLVGEALTLKLRRGLMTRAESVERRGRVYLIVRRDESW